jgi:hypothetical protein
LAARGGGDSCEIIFRPGGCADGRLSAHSADANWERICSMRRVPVLGFLAVLGANLAGGCTPYIPVEDAFGTSALKPTGNIPPEFAEFNNYDPGVNALLADQVCATPDILLAEKSLRGAPGELIAAQDRCRPYEVTIHNLDEVFLP